MSMVGSVLRAELRSDATSTASRRGEVAGIEPAMRSLVQMNSAPCATSIRARNATRPTAMRQYRLRYQVGRMLDVGRFVAGAPYREDHRRLRRALLDLLAEPLDEGVDAAHGDEGLILPDSAQ